MVKVQTFHNSIVLQSCTYCIYEEVTKEGYLVDAGDAGPVLSFMNQQGIELKGIFLTHCHFDHVYGINEFLKALPGTKVFCSEGTKEGLQDENLNMAFMYQEEEFIGPADFNYNIIDRESKIICFKKHIEIIETSGHDKDCLSYIIDDNIFTGDSYTPYADVIYPWKHSNKEDAIKNEQFIKSLIASRNLKVYPGHYQK